MAAVRRQVHPAPRLPRSKAFDAATPEVKQAWQAVLDADRTNDYVKGLSLCSSLLGETLPPEQRNAVARLSTSLKQRMSDARTKGTPPPKRLCKSCGRDPAAASGNALHALQPIGLLWSPGNNLVRGRQWWERCVRLNLIPVGDAVIIVSALERWIAVALLDEEAD